MFISGRTYAKSARAVVADLSDNMTTRNVTFFIQQESGRTIGFLLGWWWVYWGWKSCHPKAQSILETCRIKPMKSTQTLCFQCVCFCTKKRTFTTWILRFMFNMWYVDLWGVWPNPSLCLVHFFRDSARRSKKDKKNKAVKANGSGAKVRKAAWHPSGCGSHFWWAYWVQLLCVPQIPITGDQKCHAFCECNTAITLFLSAWSETSLCEGVYFLTFMWAKVKTHLISLGDGHQQNRTPIRYQHSYE